MGKIESVVKAEILRLARKEMRPAITPLTRRVRALNRQVKALTAENQRLARLVRRLEAARVQQVGKLTVSEKEVSRTRMSAGLIKKLRKRLGLTQQQLATLVSVSAAAVQSWEQGIARPTGDNRSALAALRKLGRRDVAKLLSEKGLTPGRKRRAAKAAPKKAKKTEKAKRTKKAKRPKRAKKAKAGGRKTAGKRR